MEKQLKLLISDNTDEFDNEYIRAFENAGLTIIRSPKDGLSLLDKIEAISPDVVLLDLFMPRLDAIGVIRSIHKNPSAKKPAFVVMSTFSSPVLEREVMSAGASYFAICPFSGRDLAERMIRLCRSSAGFSAKALGVPSVEIQVTEILHQIGVPAHIKGYHYLRDSIIMAIETPDIINAVTKQLYPSVAKRYETTSSRVERAIRHAIEVAWDRGDVDVLNSYFGYTIQNSRGKPTNSEFIAMISDKLSLRMRMAG